MNDLLLRFILKYLGVPHVGTNTANSGQCVGLVEQWADWLHLPWIPGNAKDLLNLADLSLYSLVRNNPTNYPPPGAIVCWDGTWGNGYGHTAVVIAANIHYIATFEQNDPVGSPPIISTHNYGGVAGWLAKK